MLALVFNQPDTSATVGAGGAPDGGWVGLYLRQPEKAPKPVSVAAVARAAPGQVFSHSAPGRAVGFQPEIVIGALARATPGQCFSASALGRAVGAARALGRPAWAFSGSRPGAASGAAAVNSQASTARSAPRRGAATGAQNPTDEQLAAFALLLDAEFDSLEV